MYFLSPSYTSGSVIVSWTPDGTSGIYLWGAQLSDSASLDTYAPVYGAAVTSAAYYGPRRDFNGSTLACNGLLVEEQRVNIETYSNSFSNWTLGDILAFGSGSTLNAAISPDGTMNAALIVPNTSNSPNHMLKGGARTVTSGSSYTLSVFVKAAGYSKVAIWEDYSTLVYASYSLSGSGSVLSTGGAAYVGSSITAIGNGWYRIAVTLTSGASGRFIIVPLPAAYTTGTPQTYSYSGDGTSGIYIYGAQYELGSFNTSYIPTGSATATRTADVAIVSTQAFPYSNTEGTVVVAWSMIASKTQTGYPAAVQLDAGSGTAYIAIRQDGTGDARRYGIVETPTTVVAMLNTTAETPTANTVLKAGLAFKQDDFAFTRGSTLATNSSGLVPGSLTTMRLGNNEASIYVNCHIRQITYLPRRISNAELQTRTS
jgi:hypothetical protein